MKLVSLTEADRKISEIGNTFCLNINPVNEEEEKRKFFLDENYNPVFSYSKEKPYTYLIKELDAVPTDSSIIGKLLKEKKHEYIRQLILLDSVAEPAFPAHSINCYGVPGKKLVDLSYQLVRKRQHRLDTEELDRERIIPSLNYSLMQFGLDWTVEERPMVIKASVHHSKKKLYVNSSLRITRDVVTRLISHEIGTHILRAENGRSQDFLLFFDGFPNYAMTEEGLAVLNEQLSGLSKTNLLKMYAGRVIAIDAALNSSFSETYLELRKYFPKNDAWTLAVRAKRGMKDTSVPGAFTKDYLYLHGYLSVKEYLEKGGHLYSLYFGKIGVEHVSLLKDIPNLHEPVYLPPNIEKPRIALRKLVPLSAFF